MYFASHLLLIVDFKTILLFASLNIIDHIVVSIFPFSKTVGKLEAANTTQPTAGYVYPATPEPLPRTGHIAAAGVQCFPPCLRDM